MKTLITISSWVGAATNGDNQAQRETFLRDVSKFPGLDYRFFVGDGTPTGKDESAMWASFDDTDPIWWELPAYKAKALATIRTPQAYTPQPDEVLLAVPDDYAHLAYKVRAQHAWALSHGYDFVFQCGTDIYIDLHRLMASGFAEHDYVGRRNGFHPAANGVYASGGGYILSADAMNLVSDEPVKVWPEDMDIGRLMNYYGVALHHDSRYAVQYPSREFVSMHLGPTNPRAPVAYDSRLMYNVHRLFL